MNYKHLVAAVMLVVTLTMSPFYDFYTTAIVTEKFFYKLPNIC